MPHSKPRTLIIRIMLALVFTLGTAASVTIATQSPARASIPCNAAQDSSGEWWVPYGCSGVPIPGAHKCAETGYGSDASGNPTWAVECADIYATDNSSTTYVWGEGEFYCQGEYAQCQGMNVSVDFSATDSLFGAYTAPIRNYQCNPSIGACPNGGRAMVSTAHFTDKYADCVDTYSWDPADGWHGAHQVISVKPFGHAIHSATQLDSNHVTVCFHQYI